MINTYNAIMTATKRIPVSEGVWEEISELKRPGQTFDDLLAQMVEQEKKRRFMRRWIVSKRKGILWSRLCRFDTD